MVKLACVVVVLLTGLLLFKHIAEHQHYAYIDLYKRKVYLSQTEITERQMS